VNRADAHPADHPEPECDEALRVLDLARPGESDAAAVARAEGHLVNCARCRAVVAARQRFDRQVARLLQDAEVPAAGVAQLRLKLAAARALRESREASQTVAAAAALVAPPAAAPRGTAPAATGSQPTSTQSPGSQTTGSQSTGVSQRRVWLKRIAAVVALVLLAWWSVWWQALPQTSFTRLVGALTQLDWSQRDWQLTRLAPLHRLQNGAEPRLPDEIETRQIALGPGALEVDRVQAAVFLFQFTRRGANQVQAALAVIPVKQVQDAHGRQRFLGVPPLVEGDLCAATWVEGDLAYVCCVKGNRSDLQELARPRPAA
jgi:hypothetical protein